MITLQKYVRGKLRSAFRLIKSLEERQRTIYKVATSIVKFQRGFLDYGMIWTVAAVSVLLSVLFYQAVVIVERRVLRRLGMATAE